MAALELVGGNPPARTVRQEFAHRFRHQARGVLRNLGGFSIRTQLQGRRATRRPLRQRLVGDAGEYRPGGDFGSYQ